MVAPGHNGQMAGSQVGPDFIPVSSPIYACTWKLMQLIKTVLILKMPLDSNLFYYLYTCPGMSGFLLGLIMTVQLSFLPSFNLLRV